MKIARACADGSPFWAVVDVEQRTVRPIAEAFRDWAPRLAAGAGEAGLTFTGDTLELGALRLLPPIEAPAQVFVVGANYLRHLSEFKLDPPKAPVAFLKSVRALIGANDPIVYPRLTHELDYEVELVAVVGAPVPASGDPTRCLLGYTVGNDVSARDLQRGGIGMDLFSAKSLDLTTGLGPWIVTRDEFGDGSPDLQLRLKVNGEVRQDGRTDQMRWDVGHLLAFINDRVRLHPGDVMFTGTPEGVGQATGRYLQVGDRVEAEVERIGVLDNTVAPAT
jgi:2-keto-4-pentenoate hydratase/2-oxohepta-3-ene-1,7-dioic acid hydratase in catechol pathway